MSKYKNDAWSLTPKRSKAKKKYSQPYSLFLDGIRFRDDPLYGTSFFDDPLDEAEAPSTCQVSPRQALLDEAAKIVSGSREATYGGPEQSFSTIAALWTAYLGRRLIGYSLAPHDVAAMQALLKLARIKESEGQHRDSWVDLAGYAACGAECAQAEAGYATNS